MKAALLRLCISLALCWRTSWSCSLCPAGALLGDNQVGDNPVGLSPAMSCREIAGFIESMEPTECMWNKLGFKQICCWNGNSMDDAPPETRELNWTSFEENGFITVPGVLTEAQMSRTKRMIRSSPEASDSFFQFRQEGFLMDYDEIFIDILESIPPQVEAYMFRMMGPWIVGAYAQITLKPVPRFIYGDDEQFFRAKAGGMHADYPYGGHGCIGHDCPDSTPPQFPATVQLIFMITDFTEDNGATLLLPGSHAPRRNPRTQEHRDNFSANAIHATGKAGDLIMYNGLMWHSSGLNTGTTERTGIVIQCLPYFMKPMHGHMFTFQHRVAKRLPQRLKNRLGLKGSDQFHHTNGLGSVLRGRPVWQTCKFLYDALYHGYDGDTASFRYMAGAVIFASLRGPSEFIKSFAFLSLGVLLGAMMTLSKFNV